jgi:hypothetical protein
MIDDNSPREIKHCNTSAKHPQHDWYLGAGYGHKLTCEGQELFPSIAASKAENPPQPKRSYEDVIHTLARLGGAKIDVGQLDDLTMMPDGQYQVRLATLTKGIALHDGPVYVDHGDSVAKWSPGTKALIDRETEKARYREEEAVAKAKAVERDRPEREYLEAKRVHLDPDDEWGGTDLAYILFTLIPDLEQQLINAARHYGATNHNKLGIKAQYVDLHRKMGPLRSALWEDQILTRESPSQILMDLAGHAFLTRAMLDRGTGDGTYDDL